MCQLKFFYFPLINKALGFGYGFYIILLGLSFIKVFGVDC